MEQWPNLVRGEQPPFGDLQTTRRVALRFFSSANEIICLIAVALSRR